MVNACAGTVMRSSWCLWCAHLLLISHLAAVLQVGVFLNRLSDYLFTAARFAVSPGMQ